jgi:hypothetical protein
LSKITLFKKPAGNFHHSKKELIGVAAFIRCRFRFILYYYIFQTNSLVGQLRSLSGLSRFSGSTNSINSLPSQPAAPLAGQLALFSRELVDLLKTSPGCRMPFHKFIPSYHHHFGRQCR